MRFWVKKLLSLFNHHAQNENLVHYRDALRNGRIWPLLKNENAVPVATYDSSTQKFTFIFLKTKKDSPLRKALDEHNTHQALHLLNDKNHSGDISFYTKKKSLKTVQRNLQKNLTYTDHLVGMIDFYLTPVEVIQEREEHMPPAKILEHKMYLNMQMTAENARATFLLYKDVSACALTFKDVTALSVHDKVQEHARQLAKNELKGIDISDINSYTRTSLDIAIEAGNNRFQDQALPSDINGIKSAASLHTARNVSRMAMDIIFSPTIKN